MSGSRSALVVAASLAAAAGAAVLPIAPNAVPAANAVDAAECSDGTGVRIPDVPPALAGLQTELAWGVTRGNGVLVAVVDSGIDASNPHLGGAVQGGADLVGDGLGAGGTTDLDGHGTAVAGQIAARSVDGSGVVGLAPEARLFSVRIFAANDEQARKDGTAPTIERIAQGIRTAVAAHAQIINVSLSTSVDAPELRDAVAFAAENGSLVIASSGNSDAADSADTARDDDADRGPRYPAGDPGALGVSALDPDGTASAASVHGAHVAIAAPGQNVLTTARAGIDCVYAGDAAATSFATAYVSGAAALVAAAHPDETPAQWAYRLMASAVRPDPDARDDALGWGAVQPWEAITLVPGAGVPGPTSPFGTTSGTPRHEGAPVRLAHRAPAEEAATTIAVLSGVGAAVVLGTLAVVGLLLRRRRTPEDALTEP